jgi:protein PhnA
MSLERELMKRSGGKCELSGVTEDLKVYQILPTRKGGIDESVLLHTTLIDQIDNPEKMDLNFWRFLNDSMWSEHLPVQIISWRMLSRLGNLELVEQMYLNEDNLAWAKASGEGEVDENKIIHRDSNGVIL